MQTTMEILRIKEKCPRPHTVKWRMPLTDLLEDQTWGDSSVGTVLAEQAQGLGLDPQNPHESRVWWCTAVTPVQEGGTETEGFLTLDGQPAQMNRQTLTSARGPYP